MKFRLAKICPLLPFVLILSLLLASCCGEKVRLKKSYTSAEELQQDIVSAVSEQYGMQFEIGKGLGGSDATIGVRGKDFGFCREDYTPFMFLLEESIFFIYDSKETEEQKENRLRLEKKKASDLCRLFKLLLEKGVDVNAQTNDHNKMTALILLADRYATTRNDAPKLPIAKVLLDGGADVDIQDAYGKTALMCFAEISWAREITDIVDWIRLLVSYGADKTLRDEKGLTALDYFHRSCRRDDLKEAEIPVYDEIERLLTPEAKSTTPKSEKSKISEIRTDGQTLVAKATAEEKNDKIADLRTVKTGVSKKEAEMPKIEAEEHIALCDISDDW